MRRQSESQIPHPRKYWTFVMSWHRDQWRKDLVVICMKTGNLGIYLNFKNLSKTWHVNTNREQIHNGLFLSIHFHLLSNVMLFVEKLKYAKKSRLAEDNFILNLRRNQFTMWQRHGWRNKFNLSPLLGFSLKRPEPWLSSSVNDNEQLAMSW